MHNSTREHGHEVLEEARQGEAFDYQTDTIEGGRKFYLESYGCQMNFSDSEIVASILAEQGMAPTKVLEEAHLIFLNTCSIREKAEETVRKRLKEFRGLKRQIRNY